MSTNAGGFDPRAIELAAVRSWPALETATIDGWLARASSGGSVRANSVSALEWTGADLDAAIAQVTDFYRARGAAPCFTITEVDRPAGLDAALAGRGWQRHGEHITMAKVITVSGTHDAPPRGSVIIDDAPTAGWLQVYLQGLSGNRRAIAPRIVAGVPAPRAFFSCVRDGRVIASGLSVLDGPLASVQCMATLTEARRTGAASAVLAAIEAWASAGGARSLYLQADAGNGAATALYGRQGFVVVGYYHTRELPA